MKSENIFTTGHPFFGQFIPIPRKKLKVEYKKALLLPPDLIARNGMHKIQNESRFYNNVISLMFSLNIEIVGVKIRDNAHFRARSLGKLLSINGVNVPLITEEFLFSDIVKNADLVVGPISTAIMESGLSGVDYFVYDPIIPKPSDKFRLSLQKYVNVSHSIEELKENILQKQPYVKEHGVNDLVDLFNAKDCKSICLKLDSVIRSLI